MPRKKRISYDLSQANELRGNAGLPVLESTDLEKLENALPVDLSRFLDWFKTEKPKSSEDMYCFIMYDIENNKIRRILSKFLEKKGCIRIQKSVFFAKIHRRLFKEIKGVISDLQQCYENQDTIIMLPVGEDLLNNMHCIGKNFDMELLTKEKHTLIF